MCEDESLLAEAAMQRILRRTLPAQRHEVLGALSALKLQLAVARRRLLRDAEAMPGQDDAAARLQLFDSMADQQLAAQTALTGFRLWDGLAAQRRPLGAVLAQCMDWTRQAAAMRGHHLPDGVETAVAEGPSVDVPAAHFLVLALLYEVLDRLTAPSQLALSMASAGTDWHIALHSRARADEDGLPPMALDPAPGSGPAPWLQTTIRHGMGAALCAHLATPGGQWHWHDADPVAGTASLLVYAPRA